MTAAVFLLDVGAGGPFMFIFPFLPVVVWVGRGSLPHRLFDYISVAGGDDALVVPLASIAVSAAWPCA